VSAGKPEIAAFSPTDAELSGLRWVDASFIADLLSVEREFVYANAARLGARRLGSGPRARLRFHVPTVLGALTLCDTGRESHESITRAVKPRKRGTGSNGLGRNVELLPIRGRRAS
jgi:hypothetical protein